MTWQLGLDFVARTSWPLTVLMLGLIFHKPLKKFIFNLNRFKFGGVEAETDISEHTEEAAAKLGPDSDDQSSDDKAFGSGSVSRKTDEANDISKPKELKDLLDIDGLGERLNNILNGEVMSGLNRPEGRLSRAVQNLLINNPAAAIQVSAVEYGTTISNILRVLDNENPAERKRRWPSHRPIGIHPAFLLEAFKREILTREEYEASRDLARAVEPIDENKGQIDVDRRTAREFAKTCAALNSIVRRRSIPMLEKVLENINSTPEKGRMEKPS